MSKINFFVLVILCGISLSLESCSGCSRSGRKAALKHSESRNIRRSQSKPLERETSPIMDSQKSSRITKITTKSETGSLSDLYERCRKSVFIVYTSNGSESYQGTGFFINANGIGVSNYHVFKGTSMGLEKIVTWDGKQYKIDRVINKSRENDYIIFKLSGRSNGSYLPISSVKPKVGEDVFAIGNPKGLEQTLSKGIISAYRDEQNLIQTTTEITNGSSGGPLMNMQGEVVGITTSGIGEANLNFVVDIQILNLKRYN